MAYTARLSDYVRGGILGQSLQEGLAVTFTQSGTVNELPIIIGASTGMVNNVGILLKGPDDFPRPTDSRMYTASRLATIDPNTGFGDPVNTLTTYNVGKSTLWNPTLVSGEQGLLARGGTYAVPSGTFVDSAGIKVPGAMIKVTGNKWDVTTSQTDAIGVTEEYNYTNGMLLFTLWH